MFLKTLQNSQENACVVSLFSNVAGIQRKPPTQEFSCEIGKIFKNSYIVEHLRMAASGIKLTIQTYFGRTSFLFATN